MARTRIIKFIPAPALVKATNQIVEPYPASSAVPDWYRRADVYSKTPDGRSVNALKTCVPFLDSLVSGYMIPIQSTVYVYRNSDGTRSVEWDGNFPIVKERQHDTAATAPRPDGHLSNHMIWNNPWGVQTPKGFSAMWTHPLNRHDLPFVTASGIVDSDKFYAWGNLPFFLRSDFEGEIPAGTPFAQVLPVKREQWASLVDVWTNFRGSRHGAEARTVDRGWYRDNAWTRKVFR